MNAPRSQTAELIGRYWLAVAIACVVALAWFVPGPSHHFSRFHVIDIGVVAVMFLGGLKLPLAQFVKTLTKPQLVLLSCAVVFGVAPAIGVLLSFPFGLSSPQDRLAILICASGSSTLATGIVLTEIAGGDVALAMVITVVNNVASAILTPVVFLLWSDSEIQVDHIAMALELAGKIVLPVLAAQLMRRWLSEWAARNSRALSIVSQLIVLVYIYAGTASATERLEGHWAVLGAVIGLAATLHLALIAINAIIGRFATTDPSARIAFVMCSSQKTLPAAILIWKNHLTSLPLGPLVAVVYHLFQLVVDSIAAPNLGRYPLIRGPQKGRH